MCHWWSRPPFPPQPRPPQGTPLKYDTSTSSTGSKKHDVRSIIGSPGRTFPAVHPLDVMADTRALERVCYGMIFSVLQISTQRKDTVPPLYTVPFNLLQLAN